MNRRKFFSFLSTAPVGIVPLAIHHVQANDAPDNVANISLVAPDRETKVGIAVGKDGALWTKPNNGHWKRVKTE